MRGFTPGLLFLYERMRLPREVLQVIIISSDYWNIAINWKRTPIPITKTTKAPTASATKSVCKHSVAPAHDGMYAQQAEATAVGKCMRLLPSWMAAD
jgi:hypothetical protein